MGKRTARCVIRHVSAQERRDWPQLVEEQSTWVAECPCGDWAYGRRKADVAAWAAGHERGHPPVGHAVMVYSVKAGAVAECACGWRVVGRDLR